MSQRLEYVRQNSLCTTCLKPGHNPVDCQSKYTCHVCYGAHNTLIHTESSAANPPPTSGTVNLAKETTKPGSSQKKKKLMMTCMALATGPTGKSMPVRALSDSGSDVSLVTNRVAKHLKLKKLDEVVAIESYGDSSTKTCLPTANFVISSFPSTDDWSTQVTAATERNLCSKGPAPSRPSVPQTRTNKCAPGDRCPT